MCPIAGLLEEPPEDRDLKEKKGVQKCVCPRAVEPHCGPCHGRASAYAQGILIA